MGNRFLAVLGFLTFTYVYSFHVIAPLLTPIGREFGIPTGVAGLAAAVYGLPGIPMGILVGPYSDRFGRKGFLIGGAMLIGGFNLLAALAPSFPLLVVARTLAGFGAPMIFANMQASMADAFPYHERGRAQSVIVTVNQAGPLVGIPLAGVLAEAFSWRLSIAVVGLLALLAGLIIWRLFPGDLHQRSVAGRRELYGSVLGNASARSALIGFMLSQMSWFAWVTYLVVFIERTYDMSPAVAATIALTNGLGIAGGSLLAGRVGDQRGHKALLVPTSLVLAGLFVLTTALRWPLPVGMLLIFAVSAFVGGRFSTSGVVILEQVPAARGTMASVMASVNGVGQSMGPFSGGLIVDRLGFGALGLWCAAGSAVAAAAFLGVKERARRREAP